METNHPQNKLPMTNFIREDLPETADKATNLARIKELFEAGEKLTVITTYKKVSTFELKHYVSELRRIYKLPIIDKWMSNDRKRWKVYWLAK